MLYNKNNVRKTNDKKILHKVGKQWKVVSVALLMAIGGGAAVATHANAQSNQGENAATADEATELETPVSVQVPQSVAPTSASAKSASATSAKPSSAVSYLNDNGGSAASYRAKAFSDANTAKANKGVVDTYVNSLNAKFPSATSSLASASVSASSAANGYSLKANSYSAVAKNSANSEVVSTLASKAGLTTSAYVDTVKYQASHYANSVKSASANTAAMSLAYSLVNEASGMSGELPELVAEAQVSAAVNGTKYTTAKSLVGVAQSVADAAVSASSQNDANLTNATVESIEASGAAEVAMANSGADASNVNSFAQANSLVSESGSKKVEANWNSSAVSSAVSSAANNFASTRDESSVNVAYSDFNGSFNFAFASSVNAMSAGDAKNNTLKSIASDASSSADMSMYQVVADTYNLSSASNARAFDASVMASAKASKAYYASNVAATSLAAKNAANNIKTLGLKADAANVAYKVLNQVSNGAQANGSATYALDLLNDVANNGVKATFGLSGAADAAGAKELANESGIDINAMLSDKGAIENMAKQLRSGYYAASASSAASGNSDDVDKLNAFNSAMDSTAASAESNYTSTVSASNSYAKSTDEDVTLAGYYASSYAADAKSEASVASDTAKALNDFYLANADDKFASADAAYLAANAAEPNDKALAYANGVYQYNHYPKYVTVAKNCGFYNNADFTKKAHMATVPAGNHFKVLGVGISTDGHTRYTVAFNGKKGYITSWPTYVESTYLQSNGNLSVTVTNPTKEYNSVNFSKKSYDGVTYKAGKVFSNVAVVSADGVYGGVTRLELANGKFISANVAYAKSNGAANGNENVSNNGLVTYWK